LFLINLQRLDGICLRFAAVASEDAVNRRLVGSDADSADGSSEFVDVPQAWLRGRRI